MEQLIEQNEAMRKLLEEIAEHLKDSRWSPEEDLYQKIIELLNQQSI